MNKKLRVLFCMLFAAIAVFALALVACDQDNSGSSTGSEASSTDDTGNTETNTGTGDTETENPDTAETDEPITLTITSVYKNDSEDESDTESGYYYAEYEYTVTEAGTYTVALTSPADTDAYIAIYINGVYYRDYVDYTYTDNITVATGDVLTFYLYDYYAEAASDYTVTITEFVVTAVVPTELTIPGDTVASLDSTGYSYDLYYTVTDETAGEYTFTLSGDDLTDVTVYIYKDNSYIMSLSSSNKTATVIYGSGSELNVWASVPSTTETAVDFTLNTAIDTSVESRTGYYAEDPILLYSGYYTYENDLSVAANDELYFKVTGSRSGSVQIALTATSSDATFTVYGYSSADTTAEYAELTLTEGSYKFTLASGSATEYIKIVATTAGTINVTAGEVYDDLATTSYTLAYYGSIKLNVAADGEYVFVVDSEGEIGITVDNEDTVYIGTDEDIYSTILTLTKGSTLYILAYSASTFSVTQGSAVNSETDSTKFALSEGDNEVAVAATDATNGVSVAFTATEAGYYTFTIADTDTDANVTVTTTLSSTTLKIGSSSYTTKTTVSYYLTENQEITVVFKTTSATAAVYGLNIAYVKTADLYQTIDATDSVTLTTYADSSVSSYTNYSFLSANGLTGSYYLTIICSSSNYNGTISVNLNNDNTEITNQNNNFNMTLTGTDSIVVTISGYASSYTFTATLTSGTYTPLTTSINSTENGSLTAGTSGNAIVLSASDAKNGYVTSFTSTDGGVYTFEIDSDEDGSVYLATSADNYTDGIYKRLYGGSWGVTSVTVVLSANETLYIVLGTYSKLEGSYTLTITKSETGTDSTSITTTEAELGTLYTDLSAEYSYMMYATITTDAYMSGDYHVAIDDDCEYISDGYTTVKVTVDGTEVTVEAGVFNISLTASTTYNIIIYVVDYSAEDYTYTAVLESGTVTISSVPATLQTGSTGNSVSLTATGAYSGVSVTYTLTAGTYTISIDNSDSNDACVEVEVNSDDNYAYFTLCTGTSHWQTYYTTYNITIADGDTVTITYYTYSYNAANYTVYLNTATAE